MPERAVRDPRHLFEAHHERVRRILAAICRRNLWLGDEADDFCQWAQLRLIDNDHALLRAFAGRSSFATFLTVVLHNLLHDYRNQRLGRWRPSAAARRLGEVGVQLDTLLHRDRGQLDVAIEILRRNHGVALSPAALASMAATLPPHYPRRSEDATAVEHRTAPEKADQRWVDGERSATARRAREALDDALRALVPEDRLVVKLRYLENLQVAQIARRLALDQKPLYRRIERLLAVLRGRLVAAGLTAEDIRGMLGLDPAVGERSSQLPAERPSDRNGRFTPRGDP